MSQSNLRVLSLGAGVQSTTLALMMSRGDLPKPDCAIFADTGWEPAATYRYLAWLEGQLSFAVRRVTAGNIRDDIMAGVTRRSGRFASVPWFTRNPDGSYGMGRRQCTTHYKIEPIAREIRSILGIGPRAHIRPASVEMLIGISTDESARMRPSRRRYMVNRWPLIEIGMSRRQALSWLTERQYPIPPKSACVGCPFHSDEMWATMKRERPAEFADTIVVDEAIRDAGTMRGLRGQQYMHPSREPLANVVFRGDHPDLFGHECEGLCGV